MIKIKLPNNVNVTPVDIGIIDPVHEIPALVNGGVEKIDLSRFDEWDDLMVDQKRYLVEYSKQNMKQKRAALASGVKVKKVLNWLATDEDFRTMYRTINDLHTEAVEEMDYKASFDPRNNMSRGRFLSKRSSLYKEGTESSKPAPIKNQTNILAVLNSSDVTGKGLAGVQQMFNQLKEQGKVGIPQD